MMATLSAIAITLGELVGPSAGPLAAAPIRDLVLDSRTAHAGAAFVALKGTRDHGLRHAADALARGAEVVLYDPDELAGETVADAVADRAVAVPRLAARCGELAGKLYGPAMRHVELAGITGTNGKTTVAHLVAQAMARAGRRCGYVGTLGNGLPDALERHALTTPDCFTLHRELAALAANGGTHAALEVSSHALAQDRIAGLAIRTAAFTNLTRDHLDAHGSLDAYGAAKARLFERAGVRYAVVNVGDVFGARLAERLASGATPIRVAAADVGSVDLGARVTSRGLEGLELELHGRFGDAGLRSPLIGTFNAENLLVALGVLIAWELPLADACAALESCSAPPGRLDVVNPHAGSAAPYVVVDYAHTPDGLERVLDTVRSLATGDVWCVFGCGGERDRGKRAPMGAIAAARADHVIVTDDNPRGEDPDSIVRDILDGVGAHPHVVVEHDRAAAIRKAIRGARPGDVVLIAGKGHETTQRIGADERPFSDRAQALAALEELG
ncbi:MAG TPA: UDP-N-acetylmuramoyl-L-alanyl-D-glutamate--2,6-diaminopimelate ligase [Gammaproteobacteria bacterium]